MPGHGNKTLDSPRGNQQRPPGGTAAPPASSSNGESPDDAARKAAQRAAQAARRWRVHRPAAWRSPEGSPDWEYQRKRDGGLRRAATSRGGARVYLSKIPEVLAHYVILGPNGEPINERLRLRRTDGREVTIGLDELESRDAWPRLGLPGKHQATRAAVYDMLKDWAAALDPTLALQSTGLHRIDGAWWFAHPSGALLGPDGAKPPQLELLGIPEVLARAAVPIGSGDPERALCTAARLGDAVLAVVAASVRSLISTLAPPSTSLFLEAAPFEGKTLLACAGRALVAGDLSSPPWPVTVTFEDAAGGAELKVGYEHDLPVVLDDFVYNPDAGAGKRASNLELLDRIVRANEHGGAIRERMNGREQTLRAARTVRSLPVVTGERWPQSAAASLIRRLLIVPVSGAVPRDALRDNRQLAADLRALGEQVIRLVVNDPAIAGRLAEVERGLREQLARRGIVPEVFAMSVARVLGGALLAAQAVRVDPRELLEQLQGAFRRWAPEQLETFTARLDRTNDLGAAVGELLRAALLERKAHVRDGDGLEVPCVPGWESQHHGLRRIGREDDERWQGDGVPVYWIKREHAFGIAGPDLHKLADNHPTLGGYLARALVEALGRAGALRKTRQKTGQWSWQRKIGGQKRRLILVRAELLEVDRKRGNLLTTVKQSGTSGTSGTSQVRASSEPAARAKTRASDQGGTAGTAGTASQESPSVVSAAEPGMPLAEALRRLRGEASPDA
jgi:hypothetical protein